MEELSARGCCACSKLSHRGVELPWAVLGGISWVWVPWCWGWGWLGEKGEAVPSPHRLSCASSRPPAPALRGAFRGSRGQERLECLLPSLTARFLLCFL